MISLESAAYVLDRLGVYTTVEGIRKRVLSGQIERASLNEDTRRYFNSRFNYGIDEKSFIEYLKYKGFKEEDYHGLL